MAKSDPTQFDYKNGASIEADVWRAYYNHQFFKLFWKLLKLAKSRANFGWFLTIRLSYYSACAAAYYRLRRHKGVDNTRVLKNLTKFYRLVSAKSVQPFDYKKAAELDLAWWEIHRHSPENSEALAKALADAAAVLYNVDSSTLCEYAHLRAEAMAMPRHEGDKQAIPTDWQKITDLLEKSWHSLHTAVQKK